MSNNPTLCALAARIGAAACNPPCAPCERGAATQQDDTPVIPGPGRGEPEIGVENVLLLVDDDGIRAFGPKDAIDLIPHELLEFVSGLRPQAKVEAEVETPVAGEQGEEASRPTMSVPGYELLAGVLERAYAQASIGKGVQRHGGRGLPFEQQPMNSLNRLLGSTDGHVYQAAKKAIESTRLPRHRAIAELLGAINYLAGAVILLDEQEAAAEPASLRGLFD